MNDPQHLTQESLDALRAGLLNTEQAHTARAHIATCAQCAASARISDTIKDALAEPTESALMRQLRVRRRGVLARETAPRHPGRWVASAAALMLGVALFLGWQRWEAAPTLVAQSEAPADVYADVEFYLWLEREGQKQNVDNPS